MIKKIFFVLLVALYVLAGINHFWHPAFYLRLIPPYLPDHVLINIAAGCAELLLGLMLLFGQTRKSAAYGIIAMLVAFIPAHVYALQISRCNGEGLCWVFAFSWIRFFIIHPFLIAWAWWQRK